jgi:hypothetical protein
MTVDTSASLPPTTTIQQDLTHEGQRRINLIWERTQAIIALFVVFGTLGIGGWLAVKDPTVQIPTIFSVAFGTVVGFYFSRTNHSAIGGIGRKDDIGQEYRGR